MAENGAGRKREAAQNDASQPALAADQTLPLPEDRAAGDEPESGEDEAAVESGRRRQDDEDDRGGDARTEIAETTRFGGSRSLLRGRAHEAVFALRIPDSRPPKRRSRCANSAMASSSAALSKSGQWIGRKTNSV